ncbi:hypothetical protein SEUCBS139899_004495 [Sporothrix eucalyptigena]
MTTALHGGTAPLAALTTVFTPPCPTSWLVTTTKLPSQYPVFPAADPVTTCDPPAWASNLSGEGFQYYSPAICPDGFEVGLNCQLTGTPRTTEGFPAVAADETVAWCVPSGQTCTSDTTDFKGGIWGVSRTATGASVTVTVGPAMQIRWRDVDLSILATHPLTPGLTLAGAATTSSAPAPPATSTTANAVTPTPIPQLTPDAAGTSSSQNTDTDTSSSQTTTANAGFVTIKGKSTQSSTLQPVTSTMTVVSAGSTFMSTVVTSPTAASANPNGNAEAGSSNGTASNTTSNSTTSGSTSKAFAATIIMACLLSVAAAAIVAFFLLSRRRYLRQQKTQQSGGVLENGQGGSGQPKPEPTAYDGSSSIGLSSVGVGAWVQRRKPRWRVAWRRTKAWLSELRILPWGRARRPLTGDNVSRWRRRQRQSPQVTRQLDRGIVESTEASRARTPLVELATAERALADFVELEGSPVPENLLENEGRDDGGDSDTDSYMSIQKFKGIPARRPGANNSNSNSANRLSWMSRLSRYMRGGRNTPGAGGRDTPNSLYDDAAADRSVISRTSTRSSRWTRADTASVMTSRGGLDDDDCPYSGVDDVHESSWEAFSRSREGLGRLLLVKQKGGTCPDGMPRRGHTRGLSVPNNSSNGSNIPRLPSPAITVRSDRAGTPGLLSTNSNRFSRLSNGTFGGMDSFISRDGSRAGARTSTEGGA